LAPTVWIAVTGFRYPGGILQLFHREDQKFLQLPNSSSQIVSAEFIINNQCGIFFEVHRQQQHCS
jgi:hypothetical protein